ncbi:MAG: hypothetical protein AB1700_18810 [Bacillota bacterium]
MKLRRLNSTGISRFVDWLDRLRAGKSDPTPIYLLEDAECSGELEWDVDIDDRDFKNRYELGEYLVERLKVCDQRAIQNDAGMWTWLALFWFDRLCPAEPGDSRKPLRNDNYILSDRHRDYHRHAIRTTWLFVREHGQTVQFVFSNPLSKRGELTEQLTSRPYFLSCPGLMEAAKDLYSDPNRGTWKRGAAGSRAGSVRRFGLVLKQFELTYDLYSMKKDEILSILPFKEFTRFMLAPPATPSVP